MNAQRYILAESAWGMLEELERAGSTHRIRRIRPTIRKPVITLVTGL